MLRVRMLQVIRLQTVAHFRNVHVFQVVASFACLLWFAWLLLSFPFLSSSPGPGVSQFSFASLPFPCSPVQDGYACVAPSLISCPDKEPSGQCTTGR